MKFAAKESRNLSLLAVHLSARMRKRVAAQWTADVSNNVSNRLDARAIN
jgi:hypothetical protein